VTIAAGTSIDVIEMDAASNRSVDDVRDLRERVAYAPAGGHWKVYILDEAHMLTKEAWNAFLKTLEEPPPKTVFVLATTESHKVMATIADRCQRFDFQRPSLEQISEVLNRVAVEESIEVDAGAVAMIARSASGSFRDALGTLDQLVAFGGNKVGLDEVLEMLGAADAELLFDAVDAVVAEDPKAVLLGVEKMARSGRDPSQFARDLLAHLRFLLVTQTTGEVPTSFVVTATDSARLQSQAAAVGPAALIRAIDELAMALTAVREGDDARMAVEIALLKAARPDLDPSIEGLLRRIERLEGRLGDGSGQATGPVAAGDPPPPPVAKASSGVGPPTAPPAADAPPADDQGSDAAESVRAAAEAVPAEEEEPAEEAEVPAAPAASGSEGELDLEGLKRAWPAILDQLGKTAPALAAFFEEARPVGFDAAGSVVEISFPAAATFNKRKAEVPEQRERVAEALQTVTGQDLNPVYVLLDGESKEPEAPAPAVKSEGVDEEELLERLKSEFDAEEVS
jgi:DNA polymerase-3 subunit gamma/tau